MPVDCFHLNERITSRIRKMMMRAKGIVTPSAVARLTPIPVSGERTSISAPSTIATAPPTPKMPWLGNLASRMKSASARTTRTNPVKLTGSRCMA